MSPRIGNWCALQQLDVGGHVRSSLVARWRCRWVFAVVALMFLLGLLLPGVSHIPVTASGSSNAAESLSSELQTWLNTTVHTGQFAELRWPDFSDYRKHVDKFYEFNGHSLWWTKGYEPTAQA